jgi:hypothetical protein
MHMTLVAKSATYLFLIATMFAIGLKVTGREILLAIARVATSTPTMGMSTKFANRLIAQKSFPGTNVDVAVVAFSSLMVPPNMLFMVYQTIKSKRAETRNREEG